MGFLVRFLGVLVALVFWGGATPLLAQQDTPSLEATEPGGNETDEASQADQTSEALTSAGHTRLSQRQIDFLNDWTATARRAENTIEANRASIAALEGLREEVAGYRAIFSKTRDDSTARLNTLQAQLDALGPAPEDGKAEPIEIATLRAEIKEKMEELRVPVLITRENFTRADGIISEIDRLIRERRAAQILQRTVSPLNPAHWSRALEDYADGIRDVITETRVNLRNKVEQKLLRKSAPVVLVLLAFGFLFLLRGRPWAEWFGNKLRRLGGRGTGVWRFVVSLGRIVIPLVGVLLISVALVTSQVLGLRGQLVLEQVPQWAAMLLGYRWLADRLYPKRDEDCFFGMSTQNRGAARRNLTALGVMLVTFDVLRLFEVIENLPDSSRAVVGFIPILVTSLLLFRLRQVILREVVRRREENETADIRLGIFRFAPTLRMITLVVAFTTPILAAVGYARLAELGQYAYIQTLGLYGLLLVLQKFFVDLYAWLSRKGLAAVEEGVAPFFIGMILVLLAFPLLALIWGARMFELTELWQQFLEGVPIGETRITPVDFLTFVIVFVIGYTLTRMFQGALRNNLLPKTSLDAGGQTAVVSGVGYVGIFLAALIAVAMAGIDLSGLAIVAGALSVGIGFGLQTIVSNFVSGIILLIERPVSEGDWIEVGGQMGYVRDISVRSTRIETFDRTDVIVPNSDLISGTVTNYTRGNTVGRVIVPVGVAYGTDTRLVERILREIAEAHPMVLGNPAPNVVFQGFGADSLDFEIRAILRDVNWMLSVKSEMNHEIARRFVEAGIEIPFAQRDIWIRNPEALVPGEKSTNPEKPAETAQVSETMRPDMQDFDGGADGEGDNR
ncbi:DUF3772 domain-containing protein [Shimia aestuarii]|uniref:Small-conductance mechanosensitive channel n=1 Tax=Shimia aestuarii TaxID=254406 RepID=A0A1I4NQE6_9RHOB|nr:DUF3772 domain-containing protein [Shimia aestuarii]SFM17570.1 Small-conductance mechanosensitive channel [Shimia aestuarii]